MEQTASPNSDPKLLRRRHRRAAVLTGTAVFAMLALSFAAVPLYRYFCAATGYGGMPQVAASNATAQGQRSLHVRFDANVAPGLAWKFAPETPEIELRTGQTATIFYKVTNTSDRPIAANATFNVSPDISGAYFVKIACFCFEEQKLEPHETLDLPVVFYLDPALEKDESMAKVDAVTLSYTFFPVRASTPVAASKTSGTEKPKL
jgi:cytochrome c oxidase assembly protein subunit 11